MLSAVTVLMRNVCVGQILHNTNGERNLWRCGEGSCLHRPERVPGGVVFELDETGVGFFENGGSLKGIGICEIVKFSPGFPNTFGCCFSLFFFLFFPQSTHSQDSIQYISVLMWHYPCSHQEHLTPYNALVIRGGLSSNLRITSLSSLPVIKLMC